MNAEALNHGGKSRDMDIMNPETETQVLSRDELVSRACTALWFCLCLLYTSDAADE